MKNNFKLLFFVSLALFYQCSYDTIETEELTFEELWLSDECQEQVKQLNSIYTDKDLTLQEKGLAVGQPLVEIKKLLAKHHLAETVKYEDIDKAWKKYNDKPSILISRRLKYSSWSPISQIDQCAQSTIYALYNLETQLIKEVEMSVTYPGNVSPELKDAILRALQPKKLFISSEIDKCINQLSSRAEAAHSELAGYNNPYASIAEMNILAESVIMEYEAFVSSVYMGAADLRFIITEPFNPLDYNMGGDGNTGGGGDPDPDPSPEVDEDPSWIDTKADCVKEKLETGGSSSILSKLLAGFELNESSIVLEYNVGNTTFNGRAVPNGMCLWNATDNKMYVYISNNRLNDSSLEVARTILHETFHAYIYGKLKENNLHNGLGDDATFNTTWDTYIDNFGEECDPNSSQHNYMADQYLDYIGDGLKSFVNDDPALKAWADKEESENSYFDLDQLIHAMCWGGLKGTDSYAAYTQNTDQVRIDNQIKSLFLGNGSSIPKSCDD